MIGTRLKSKTTFADDKTIGILSTPHLQGLVKSLAHH